jgi:hypothetical protein
MSQTTGKLAIALVGLCALFAANGRADCGVSGSRYSRAARLGISSTEMQALKAHALPQRPAPKDTQGPPSITGLWLITFTSDGQVVDEGFDAWHSDGIEVLNDTPPPASGNVCLGTWTQTAPLSFQLTHPSWTFDDAGNLSGIAVIAEKVALDPGGNSFAGTFTVDVYDLTDNNILHLDGQISADRVTVNYSPVEQ